MLRRPALFAALLLFLPAGAWAQLRWDAPIQHFQRAPEDRAVEAHFTFQNTGSAPVTIRSLRSSCGCTTARLEKKTYAPGERGEVVARFAFGDRKGLQRKTIAVAAGDKSEEATILELSVLIAEPLRISPALVFWRTGQPGETQTVQLTAEPSQPVRVKSVTSSNPRLGATLQTVQPGAQYLVAVRPVDTAQKESAEISVLTDFPPDAPRTYVIHARVK